MAIKTINDLKQSINDNIKINGVRSINGAVLNEEMIDTVDSIVNEYTTADNALDARVTGIENQTLKILQDPLTGWDASTGNFPGLGSAEAGFYWNVSTAGTVDGIEFDEGDSIVALVDNASAVTYAGNWIKEDNSDRVTAVRGAVGDVQSVPKRVEFAVDPTISNDSSEGYLSGDTWYNTATKTLFTLSFNGVGAAVWSSGGGTNFANMLFIDENGDDGTAEVGNSSKPFATWEAANLAAVSGDVIVQKAGSTIAVTTTAANGIAKDGVVPFFEDGATVTKSSSGSMFSTSGFSTPYKILGQGNFLGSGSCGVILRNNSGLDCDWHYDTVLNSNSDCFYDNANAANTVRLFGSNSIKSTASRTIFCYSDKLLINCPIIESTANDTIFRSVCSHTVINGERILSTGSFNSLNFFGSTGETILNAAFCSRVTIGSGPNIFNVGEITTLYNAGYTTVNGFVTNMFHTASSSKVRSVQNLTVSGGGNVKATLNNVNATANFTSTDKCICDISVQQVGVDFNNQPRTINVSGSGIVFNQVGHWRMFNTVFNISNGFFNQNGYYYNSPSSNFITTYNLTGGKMELIGTIENAATSLGVRSAIDKTGGVLVINGGKIVTSSLNQKAICSPDTPQDVKVLSGGFSTNKLNVLGVEQQYVKVVGNTPSQAQTITINGVTFTATPDTLTAMATDLANQINSSVDVNINGVVTASQDTAGVDDYFYVEGDVAGVEFLVTLVGFANVENIIYHTELMTNTTGGTVLQDINVE